MVSGAIHPIIFQYSAYQRFLGLMYQYKVILTIYFAIIFLGKSYTHDHRLRSE